MSTQPKITTRSQSGAINNLIRANEAREEERRLEKVTFPLEHPRLQSLTEGAHKCVDCSTLDLDDDKPRCEACQEDADAKEREGVIKKYWKDYVEADGRPERDTRNSDYMAACRVK